VDSSIAISKPVTSPSSGPLRVQSDPERGMKSVREGGEGAGERKRVEGGREGDSMTRSVCALLSPYLKREWGGGGGGERERKR
jgi:hypothetical protein